MLAAVLAAVSIQYEKLFQLEFLLRQKACRICACDGCDICDCLFAV